MSVSSVARASLTQRAAHAKSRGARVLAITNGFVLSEGLCVENVERRAERVSEES